MNAQSSDPSDRSDPTRPAANSARREDRDASVSSGRNDDAWLEQALRETARDHVDDDGFAARLTAALPPPRAQRRAARRQLVTGVCVTAAAALTIAFVRPEHLENANVRLREVNASLLTLLPTSDAAALVCGCVIAGACLVFASWQWVKVRGR